MRPALERRIRLKENIKSLYQFNKEILGYSAMQESPHRLMCDSVENGDKKQLQLWPRGFFKSSCITVGYVLYRIIKDPNIRILIANSTLSNAKSFLREIKGHLENNEKLREIIGDQVNKDSKWTETEIIVRGRTKNLKEPTVQVAGVGQSLVSQHYDCIICDDVENADSVNTRELLEKTKSWFKLLYSLLNPDCQLIVIGTRYHFNDLYGYLIKNFSDEFKPQIHSVFNEDGSPIFPERFSLEHIEELKKSQGSYIFSCQYLNNPVDSESAKFRKSDVLYYTNDDLDKNLHTVMAVDRAYSTSKTADYTAIVIASIDPKNNLYVRLAKRLKCREGEIIDNIFEYRQLFKVDLVGIEQKAFKDTLEPTLKDEMRKRNDYFLVEELRGRTSKVSRIEGLVPRFEAGTIFIKEEMVDLEDELLRFPVAEHDDLADALAYTLNMISPPSSESDQLMLEENDQIMESRIIWGKTGW